MNKTLFAVAALAVTLLTAPPASAATIPAIWNGAPAGLIAVDFDRGDLKGLIRAMGYRIIDIDKVKHGWLVTAKNHDGMWAIFVDDDGDVRQVKHLKKHKHDDDDDDDDDDGDHA